VKAIVPVRSSIVEGKEQQQKQKTPAEGAEREGGQDVWAISVKRLLPKERSARRWDTAALVCSAAEFISMIYSAMLKDDAQTQKYMWSVM